MQHPHGTSYTRKVSRKKNIVVVGFIIVLLLCGGIVWYSFRQDTQCTSYHTTSLQPPKSLQSAEDFFSQGNYDYTVGKCQQAITDYSKAIALNHDIPELYNNRAYTYMRMQQYAPALIDLDTALMLRPYYLEALMNRGDIYNYDFAINHQKALADYTTVMSITTPPERQMLSLCGHRLLAQTNGWSLATVWQLLLHGTHAGCQ